MENCDLPQCSFRHKKLNCWKNDHFHKKFNSLNLASAFWPKITKFHKFRLKIHNFWAMINCLFMENWIILIKNEYFWYHSSFQNNFQNEKRQIISCQAIESSHLRMSHCLFRTYPGIITTVTQHERVNFYQPVRLLPWAVSNSASGN